METKRKDQLVFKTQDRGSGNLSPIPGSAKDSQRSHRTRYSSCFGGQNVFIDHSQYYCLV